MNELHIWFNDNYPDNTRHTYREAIRSLIRGEDRVDTTQICLCTTEWLCKGYRILVHPYMGEQFEVRLEEETPKGTLINPWNDLTELLLNGEFDSDDPDEAPRSTYVTGI